MSEKRKISDFFGQSEQPDEKKQKKMSDEGKNQNTEANVQSMKCPNQKVIFDDAENEKRAPRKRSNPMQNLGKGQMVLDCGQAKIGSVTCAECGMLYCVDDASDVAEHTKFHEEWLHRYEIPTSFSKIMFHLGHRDFNNYKVFFLNPHIDPAFKAVVNQHMVHINNEIGYVGSETDIWTHVINRRIYMILMKKDGRNYIGGILVTDKLKRAWTDKTDRLIDWNNDCNDWIVGVDRIWVNPNVRKQGCAYALLDAATTQDRGMEFRSRRLRCAFSEPTDLGRVLAQRFTETRYLPEERFGGEILITKT